VRPSADAAHLEIDATDLALLLTGVEFQSARRRRRYVWRGASEASPSPAATPVSAVGALASGGPEPPRPGSKK
ncbi:MAG TPA: hypothetical protein PLV92_12170, partial [Pirellulaceae bacterium]|nr:hypothetical protein [Pirellulaceae bacterium]